MDVYLTYLNEAELVSRIFFHPSHHHCYHQISAKASVPTNFLFPISYFLNGKKPIATLSCVWFGRH